MKRLFPLALAALFFSCGKKDEVAPVIELTMPAANQSFTGGATVQIKATITDNEGIHMVHCYVTDVSTGGHMLHFEEHYDGKSFDLNNSFPTIAGRQYLIHIDATDHDDNVADKEITVSTN
jgi:hypothetical protein